MSMVPSKEVTYGTHKQSRCCAGQYCSNPELQLCPQHVCVTCGGIVHIPCSIHIEDGNEDDVICGKCSHRSKVLDPWTEEGGIPEEVCMEEGSKAEDVPMAEDGMSSSADRGTNDAPPQVEPEKLNARRKRGASSSANISTTSRKKSQRGR